MNLFFRRANDYNLTSDSLALVRNKKRRPYDSSSFKLCFQYFNGNSKAKPISDTVDGENSKKFVEDADEGTKTDRKTGAKKIVKTRNNLNDIIQILIDKIPAGMMLQTKPNLITNNISNLSTRAEHQTHVSPRKRILRELEKVSLEDLSTMKKSRAKSIANSSNIITTHSQAIGTASQSISFPHPNTSILNLNKSNGDGAGVSGRTLDNHTSVISQPVSRPISSYSITSLLSHNNQVKQDTPTSHSQKETSSTDPSQLRAMLTSPKSPEYLSQKQYITSTNFDRKKSPNSLRNSNVSPKTSSSVYTQRSPSVLESTAQLNNYGLVRSPGLSPSLEQQQNMYRYRSHYGGHHSTVTSTNSSSPNFHPYMSSSSRCSPSAISPSSDTLNSRYRSTFLLGSPNHQNYSNNNSSPSSYSRHSPISGYHQKSPQPKYINNSPTHHLNNLNLTMNKIKDLSPSNSPNSENQHDQLLSSSARTVPKKTATLRQQQQSGVFVTSANINSTNSDPYYKTPSTAKDVLKYENLSKSSEDGRKTFDNKSHGKEFDYFSNINNCGLDSIDPRLIGRPPIIPSSSMYLMFPSAIPPSTPSSYLQYYQSMSYASASAAAAAAYRNPLWMHYPNVPPSSRNPAMMPFGDSVLEPNVHSASNLWGPAQHQSLPVDPLTIMKMKEESSSGIYTNFFFY